MKRVAYLTGHYPRASHTFIEREVAALRAQGHAVETCSIRRTPASDLSGPDQVAEQSRTWHVIEHAKSPARLIGAQLHYLRRAPHLWAGALKLALSTSADGPRALLWQIFYFLEAAVLARHLEEQGVEHLHNHLASQSCNVALLASALSGIPFSFTIHGPDTFFEAPRWHLGTKARHAAFVACISHFARSQLMCFAAPADWDKLRIVHCGVTPEAYRAETFRGTRLLFVGRLVGVKGPRLLLDALVRLSAQHPEVTLTYIGDGPDRAALEAKARSEGLEDRVRFLGFQPPAAVADALADADVFCLPSFAEGVPVVLMEAMAAERAVVTSRIAGIPELIEDGVTGRLVPPGDLDALTDALSDCLSDPDRSRAMGQAARRKVAAEFNVAQEAAKLSRLIEDA
ncbi:Alpha-D-kanosaminyltransferase [Roseivivax sp. THAF40]|uniref:glycosyltransferase n=1 Tax=unclassified Roseivivax TaxID=2639302 RepID=UPI00126825A9|nr:MULTISPECIES: glycosyltransferase [unclassified Roseivivax]QFS84586.1 Alpha-D-kanosaminyltransferase [Roseivivax sp. THAF197b]QFT48413.1 Alpha-D-kanosaminyltransferase [Roseivivax sp. THAF40]